MFKASYCLGYICIKYCLTLSEPFCEETGVNDDRNSWGHSYFNVRGKILGLLIDERRRKHVPKMFPLIKNLGWGFKDDLTSLQS